MSGKTFIPIQFHSPLSGEKYFVESSFLLYYRYIWLKLPYLLGHQSFRLISRDGNLWTRKHLFFIKPTRMASARPRSKYLCVVRNRGIGLVSIFRSKYMRLYTVTRRSCILRTTESFIFSCFYAFNRL